MLSKKLSILNFSMTLEAKQKMLTFYLNWLGYVPDIFAFKMAKNQRYALVVVVGGRSQIVFKIKF